MALSEVQEVALTGGASSTSLSDPGFTATGSAAGTGLVIAVAFRNSSSPATSVSSITDSAGNTWVKAIADNPATRNQAAEIWYVDPSTYIPGVTTYTITFAAACVAVARFYEISGGASSWLDQAVKGAGANSSAPTVSTATLAQASEFAISIIGIGSNAATLSGLTSGWSTSTMDINGSSPTTEETSGHQITAATTALTFAGTISIARVWSDLIATFKAAAAVSGRPPAPLVVRQAIMRAVNF